MAKIYSVFQIKLNELVYKSVHVIIDLPMMDNKALSRRQTFIRRFTYKMAAKINWRIMEQHYFTVTLCILTCAQKLT